MSAKIALLLCTLFVIAVFRYDIKQRHNISSALWVPLIWMLILASRMVSLWFNFGGMGATPAAYQQGSPMDRTIFLALIVIGIIILSRRRIDWSTVIRENIWILIFFIYCAISILWSDFPMVSIKRWIKAIGNPIMVLIVLTEADPLEAVRTMLRRCAYLLIPFSILLIKYYPGLGRTYHPFSGELLVQGVTTNENSLGLLCMVSFLYIVWNFFTKRSDKSLPFDKTEGLLHLFYLLMIAWLFNAADSATAMICTVIGALIIASLSIPSIKRNAGSIALFLFIAILITSPVILIGYNYFLSSFIDMTGHADTFWGRVDLWPEFIELMNGSWLTGNGYGSYWLGERMEILWDRYWWHPTEAHNGYVETYLELGFIGIILLFMLIVTSFTKIIRALSQNASFELARFRIAFFVIALLYNITESASKGLHLVWFIFLLVSIEVVQRYRSTEESMQYYNSTDSG